jgi:hypothetical protein
VPGGPAAHRAAAAAARDADAVASGGVIARERRVVPRASDLRLALATALSTLTGHWLARASSHHNH